MWPDSRLIDLLGIEHPIIQAPMAGASTPAMAAASANAGCLGSLGCAMMSADVYRQNFDQTRALTNKPINVNFFCHANPTQDDKVNTAATNRLKPFYDEFGISEMPTVEATHFPFGDEMAAAVLQSNPAVVSFHFGLPDQNIINEFKARGIKILSSATTVAEARDLETRGVDAIIAQGWEAGGHHGYYLAGHDAGIGTMSLVPQLVDAVKVPVIAAGGIADGRGIAAALALGAAGVQIGTAFLTCEESAIPSIHHQSILSAEGNETIVTKAFSGRPARGIKNRYVEELSNVEDALPDFPLMNTLTGPLRKASAGASKGDFVAMWAGQSVQMGRERNVADLIDDLKTETKNVFASFNR